MPGYEADKDALVKRLKRIEGQVRGLQRMVEEDTYCIDVLTQVSATTKALQSVALLLLEDLPEETKSSNPELRLHRWNAQPPADRLVGQPPRLACEQAALEGHRPGL